ncbi:MAG: hypothetical protein ACQEQM_06020 [Thermoplasmatota archaeon]
MERKFVNKEDEKKKSEVDCNLIRLLQKSEDMEAIIAELDIDTESYISHHAKNIGDKKAVYLTVSTPPTFM